MKTWMRSLREWFDDLETVKAVRRWIWIGKLKGDMKTVREILATGEDPLHGIGIGYRTHHSTTVYHMPWKDQKPLGYVCPDTKPEGETAEPRVPPVVTAYEPEFRIPPEHEREP